MADCVFSINSKFDHFVKAKENNKNKAIAFNHVINLF